MIEQQLDLLTEYFDEPPVQYTGVKITYINGNYIDCEVLGRETPTRYKFYVLNGAWYGMLDVVTKTIEHNKSDFNKEKVVVSIDKFELY